MTSRLNPYLNFDGNAREAMEFYQEVFGGKLDMNTFGEFGDPKAAASNKIMHARLDTTSDFTLMASDLPPEMQPLGGIHNGSVSIGGEDDTELRGYWKMLSESGSVTMPLEKQIWGDVFGSCVDRFGITWLININAAQN